MDRFHDGKAGDNDDDDDEQPHALPTNRPLLVAGEAKFPAVAQHEAYDHRQQQQQQQRQGALADDEASKGSESDQDDASSEMHGGEDYGEDDTGMSGDQRLGGGSGGIAGDRLAVIKRQKRLAMNRESARNRRKRKKMLLETLQQQNDDLAKTNRSLLLSKAALTNKVQTLEHELAISRATIAQYQLGGGIGGPGSNTGVVGGRLGMLPPQHQHRTTSATNEAAAFDQQQLRPQGSDSLTSLVTSGSDSISRLIQQAQLDHLALQQQQLQQLQQQQQAPISPGLEHSHHQQQQVGRATAGGSFHVPSSSLGGHDFVSNFPSLFRSNSQQHLPQYSAFSSSSNANNNEAILRRHGLDLQALSQASRDSALESLFSRHQQQQQQHDTLLSHQQIGIGGGDGSERSLAAQSAGMRADYDLFSQQLMMDPRGGGGGAHGSSSSSSALMGGPAAASLRLPDVWLQSEASSLDDVATATNQQQILQQLLRQRSRAGSGGWDSKLPPKPSDSSM